MWVIWATAGYKDHALAGVFYEAFKAMDYSKGHSNHSFAVL